MSISRIEPLQPPYSEAVAEQLAKLMPPNSPPEPLALFRVLTHHINFTSRMRPLASGILGHGLLKADERELLILRTCAVCGAEYEWGVHVTGFANHVGLTPQQIEATVKSDHLAPVWSEKQALLIQLVDELHRHANITDELWHKINPHWDTAQIIEILIVVGWYHAISYVANVSHIPNEKWAEHFPR